MGEEFKQSLKRDLKDVVTDVTSYETRADERLAKLDEIDANLSTTLEEILTKHFELDPAEAASVGDVEEKLKYIRENHWKLKPPAAGQLKEKLYFFGQDKKAEENNIRKDMEDLLKLEAEAIKDNSEILKEYKDQLLKDEEIVNGLEAENKQYEAEINAIDAEISVLNSEIEAKKALIEATEKDIEDERQKEQEQNNIIADKQNEINENEKAKREEIANKNTLNSEKAQKEKELRELKKQLADAKRKDKDGNGDFSELENQINELGTDISKIDLEVKNSTNSITGFDNTIRTLSDEKNNAFKEKNRISEGIRRKETLLTNYRSEYTKSVEAKTAKEKEKRELVGKKAYNQEKITKYNIANRKAEYETTLANSIAFSKAIDKNNEKINQKFKDNKITEPVTAANNENNTYPEQEGQNGDNAAPSKEGKSAGQGGVVSQSASTSNAPTSEQLAKNFANDVINNSNSPALLRKQLEGYGYQTYVNALPYLENKDRKNVLLMLKERREELPILKKSDMNKVNRLLGRGTANLLFKDGKIRDLKDLSASELRQLRSAMDKYNNDILSFSNDDIKFLDDNVMKILSNSALLAEYDNNSVEKLFNRFGQNNKRVTLLRKEILSQMKEYNINKDKRFSTTVKKGNEFALLLGRDVEVNPVETTHGPTPSIIDSRSDIQKQADDFVQ